MRNKLIVAVTATFALAGAGFVVAQQKPVTSRTSIVVYKTPT